MCRASFLRLVAPVVLLCGAGTACYSSAKYPRDNPEDPAGTGDADDDGVVDPEDNCPFDANADQADIDHDEIGDACDPCVDVDDDGFGAGAGCEDVDCDDDNSSITTPECGDGNVCGDEVCDDGFEDACGSCNATCSGPGTGSMCGDGETCPELEACDLGGDGPTCDADCTLVVCGDDYPNAAAGEACDDGNTDSCTGDCLADCSATIVLTGCGDGVTCGAEECDSSAIDTTACNADCTGAVCGDDYLNPAAGEVCDDGNTDSCMGDCLADCSASIALTGCGDGATCGVEACDDGNQADGDYCSADCFTILGFCGDGAILAALEGCDDGNMTAGDGCSPACEVEEGFACEGAPSTCAVQPSVSRISLGPRAGCWVEGDPGPVRCWGFDDYTFSPPSGDYTQVVVTDHYNASACALDVAGGIDCWGNQVFPTPNATFVQFSGDYTTWCGVTDAGEILCWGTADLALPTGTFKRVAVRQQYGCAIRSDDSAVCFTAPEQPFYLITPPAGPLVDVVVTDVPTNLFGNYQSGACFHRASGQVECITVGNEYQTTLPGHFRFITPTPRDAVETFGVAAICGLRLNGTVYCSGGGTVPSPSSGTFTALATGGYDTNLGEGYVACGLDDGHRPYCWGNTSSSLAVPPPDLVADSVFISQQERMCVIDEGDLRCFDTGEQPTETSGFVKVASGGPASCGLKTDGSLSCWGSNLYQQLSPPDDVYLDVAIGPQHGCGVTDQGAVVCWGDDTQGQHDIPAGSFSQIEASGGSTCALRDDGQVQCWGAGAIVSNTGNYSSFALASYVACGIRTSDSGLGCWPYIPEDRPSGAVAAVSTGGQSSERFCALRPTGEVLCFPEYGDPLTLDGTFTAVAGGGASVCAVEATTRQVHCAGAIFR